MRYKATDALRGLIKSKEETRTTVRVMKGKNALQIPVTMAWTCAVVGTIFSAHVCALLPTRHLLRAYTRRKLRLILFVNFVTAVIGK